MGLIFRKSIKLGSIRVNFSGSGISYSTGIKGARITSGPRGTYVTIGANGIYYRKKIGRAQYQPNHRQPLPIIDPTIHTITSAPIDQLTDVDSKAFIDELSEKAAKISLFTWLGIVPMIAFFILLSANSFREREIVIQPGGERKVAIIDSYVGSNIRTNPDANSPVLRTAKDGEEFTLLAESNKKWFKIQFHDSVGYVSKKLARSSVVNDERLTRTETYSTNPYYNWMLATGFLVFLPVLFFLAKQDKRRFGMELNYEMDDQMSSIYKAFTTNFADFNSSRRKWQYLHAQRNYDWKRNAGAGRLVNRVSIGEVSAHKMPIRYFKTNVQIPYIKLRNTQLFFLPERLLVRRGNKFAAVFYKNLNIENNLTQFIEDGIVASDARIVDYTWKYVNKKGGPDRRFGNNRKIPICLYSQYTLHSATGVYEIISTSRISAFDGFSDYLKKIGQLQSAMLNGTQIS
ncbi:DUF4236 domain-containing protein [Pedobacter sp. KR3-3]|uniref:DUF4236 domain-containing protein n=1 Tax=Pedobacter albus TaxID=3113905 RepID=A0ABU7I5I3_9SPHI|nr:DUF4236 domain-containing protein [Pedobacter sp. KR3-3]MEE1944693.1 DUF4236 domain-containing protein [Pedobacter sp. KR3-3]